MTPRINLLTNCKKIVYNKQTNKKKSHNFCTIYYWTLMYSLPKQDFEETVVPYQLFKSYLVMEEIKFKGIYIRNFSTFF